VAGSDSADFAGPDTIGFPGFAFDAGSLGSTEAGACSVGSAGAEIDSSDVVVYSICSPDFFRIGTESPAFSGVSSDRSETADSSVETSYSSGGGLSIITMESISWHGEDTYIWRLCTRSLASLAAALW